MTKQTKEKEEPRRVGPKFARNVLPDGFQIRRPASPMADLLDEADRLGSSPAKPAEVSPARTPVELTPVKTTPVKTAGVVASAAAETLPGLDDFLDRILPRFPPPRQAILLRLYRWCEGEPRELVVSTPRLAAKTNMDEKVCRNHLHALIADGFILRSTDRGLIARFGGSDRNARGLILKLSTEALSELID
ncbi:MAG: hypothetical protein M3416_05150 [Acidobacteriota bacterium]|nr:hypothetical protein [Acidobacteriota bacterium]